MNVSYRRRLHQRFTVNATYTLSRALSDNGNSAAFRNRPFNPFNYFAAHDLGPTPNDTRHRFTMSGLVNLPGGIQVAPVIQWESARPYTSSYGGTFCLLRVHSRRWAVHFFSFHCHPYLAFRT